MTRIGACEVERDGNFSPIGPANVAQFAPGAVRRRIPDERGDSALKRAPSTGAYWPDCSLANARKLYFPNVGTVVYNRRMPAGVQRLGVTWMWRDERC